MSDAGRDAILKSFNCDFHFSISDDLTWTQYGGDVYEALAKVLEYVVFSDIELPRRQSIALHYLVSNDAKASGVIPIGPAYRQCRFLVQHIVKNAIIKKYGQEAETVLTEGDIESIDKLLAAKQAENKQ